MATGFTLQVIATLTDGSSTEREKIITSSVATVETFWAEARIPAAASNTQLQLNLLTDPAYLVVVGGKGIWATVTLDGDKIQCDPAGVLSKVNGSGLGLSSIYLGNTDTSEKLITVIAVEQ